LAADQYEIVADLGVDTTCGRYGEVTIWRCRRCARWWLHYCVEYEAFPRSGRCFMGRIAPRVAKTLRPEAAVPYLDRLDWHLYGGSYFEGQAGRSRGNVQVDL
jgi:hypothetical protein